MNYQNKADRHEIYLARVASHLVNIHSLEMNVALKAAKSILYSADEITSMRQLNSVIYEIDQAISPIITASMAIVTEDLESVAVNEAAFQKKLFKEVNSVSLAMLTDKKIVSKVTNSLMTLGAGSNQRSDVWSKYMTANKRSFTEKYASQIRSGYRSNESLGQIYKRLKLVNDGVLKNNARALITTATSHFANESREALMAANKKLVPNKYFSATFDSSTTDGCRGFDGQIFAVDDQSAPTLPRHWGCRSKWLFLLAGQTEPVGTKQSVSGKKGKAAKEAFDERKGKADGSKVVYKGKNDTDAFKAGQIKGSTTMDQFMSKQPQWFIEDSLGKTKAEMFMSGKASIKDFSDATGRSLTIKELIAKGF